jgi:hypothetical protein
MCMRTSLKINAILPNRTFGPKGIHSLSELSNLLRLKWCFRAPTIFLGYYITSKLVNKHRQRRKLNTIKFKEAFENVVVLQ